MWLRSNLCRKQHFWGKRSDLGVRVYEMHGFLGRTDLKAMVICWIGAIVKLSRIELVSPGFVLPGVVPTRIVIDGFQSAPGDNSSLPHTPSWL